MPVALLSARGGGPAAPGGQGPVATATSHGAVTAYVVGEKGTVTPIRVATNTALKTISDRSVDSLGVVVNPDGKTVYVVDEGCLPSTPVR